MDTAHRSPFIVALYSDAPRAGKSTSAKVLQHLAFETRLPCDLVSFAFPIRRAARQVLPASWSEEKVREHLSGKSKDAHIGELGGKTGRDLLKIIGNTVRDRIRDDLWADRLLEEIDSVGNGGIVLIDDLRFPGEYLKLRERPSFLIRLVTAQRAPSSFLRDDPRMDTEGLLQHVEFDAEVPAKGLVPQAVLEQLIGDLWESRILPKVTDHAAG